MVIAAFAPLSVDAAEQMTVAKLRSQYNDEMAKYNETQAKINLTQSQINDKQNTIENLKSEMLTISKEVDTLKEEIEKYKTEIKDKVLESRSLIEQLQINKDENSNLYYDYIFNSQSVSDMVYRSAVIQEIMEYNEKTVNTLNSMIEDNNKREKEIENRKTEITKLESELNNQVATLGEQKNSLKSGGVTIEKQLAQLKEKIDYYVNVEKCKENDIIGVNCAVPKSTGVWRRPTETGYVTQNAYYGSYTHRALDIGSSRGRGEKIYPVLDGKISQIYNDYYGANIVAVEHYLASEGTYYTSLYVHLSKYAPGLYVGKRVTTDDYLGYMGDTGYAFGVHLHIELFPCRLYTDSQCRTWNAWVNFAENKLRNGYNPRSKIPVTNGLYNSWSTR
jgi:peptidoglycan hydrolase CwlO-like protein